MGNEEKHKAQVHLQAIESEQVRDTGASQSVMTVKDTATVKKTRRPLPPILLVLLSLVAGFLGAWLFSKFGGTGIVTSSTGLVMSNNTTQPVITREGKLVSDIAKVVSPSVVSIVAASTQIGLFGLQSQAESAGTGVIISADGYILTNRHVIPDGATKVKVILSDGMSYDGVSVVGRDAANDLAFLKIGGVNNLKPAVLGDSSSAIVGQDVVAIGNALGQYQTTVTTGIISGLGRPVTAGDATGSSTETLENLLQTDAAINPGNSGGPLVNMNGEVIGINTAIAQDAQGIGFAIPINQAKGLAQTVVKTGKVSRPILGIRYVSLTPEIAKETNTPVENGAYILASQSGQPGIVSGGPADKAGLQEKDIITKLNDITIDAQHPLASVVANFAPDQTITVTYMRGNATQTTQLTLSSN